MSSSGAVGPSTRLIRFDKDYFKNPPQPWVVMANPCVRWENKLNTAIKENNQFQQLKFREKLAECIVYTARSLISEREFDELDELMKYGLDIAKKYNMPELEFQLKLIDEERQRVIKARQGARSK